MLSDDDIRETVQMDEPNSYLRVALVLIGLLLLTTALLSGTEQPAENAPPPDLAKSPAAAGHSAEEKSHARAITVADVFGTVKVLKPGAAVDAPLAVNTPIQQGFQVSTAADSSASVEFEHDSTAIVGAHSRLIFERLELDANGARLTGMTLKHGLVTLRVVPQRHSAAQKDGSLETAVASATSPRADIYEIKFGDATATVAGKCRFRVDVKGAYVRVEVFKGELLFATPAQSVELGAGKSLEHRLGGTETAFNIHSGIVKDPWDNWASAEEQKVLNEPKQTAGKGQQPEDLDAMIRQRHWESSSPGDRGQPTPSRRRY